MIEELRNLVLHIARWSWPFTAAYVTAVAVANFIEKRQRLSTQAADRLFWRWLIWGMLAAVGLRLFL